MLIRFAFENFKSFAGRGELNLEAHKADKTLPGAVIERSLGVEGEGGDLRLLPATAIYGPNAAGKSNVIDALSCLSGAVRFSQVKWRPGTGTRVVPHAARQGEATEFEIELIVESVRYRYGFKATAQIFTEEWLYSYPKKRERVLFERSTKSVDGHTLVEVEVGAAFGGNDRDHEGFRRRTRDNSLFLSACAQDNHDVSIAIQNWFMKLAIVGLARPPSWFTSAFCSMSESSRNAVVSLLRSADAALADIEIIEGAAEASSVPSNNELSGEELEFFTEHRNHEVRFKINDQDGVFELPLDAQSQGIQRLYGIAWAITGTLRLGSIIVIDELEGSMHPHMAAQILGLFQSHSTNPKGGQLIFSTHDTNLLNIRHLRRDQIWFVEKEASRSHLYPLLDFAPRKDENLEVGYLRGRYGAIPALGLDADWVNGGADATVLTD